MLEPVRFKKDGSISKGRGEKGYFIDMTNPKNKIAAEYVLRRSERNLPIKVPPNTVALYDIQE
jgi:hypothetical protein